MLRVETEFTTTSDPISIYRNEYRILKIGLQVYQMQRKNIEIPEWLRNTMIKPYPEIE
jgi:hypothetical protein